MPSSTVQTMPGPSRLPASTTTVGGPHPQHSLNHSGSSFSLRNFIAEEDGFSAAMLKSVDKDAFLAAQRQALAAFDDAALARALQASEETAAEEARKRGAVAARVLPSDERTIIPPPSAPIQVPVQNQLESRYITDEEAARSLARSWRVDALQPALLDSSAITAVSIPASSFSHAQTPASHASISTSPPHENSRNGDPSSRRLQAPQSALLDSSAIAAVSIPASSFIHAQSPSASASTSHVSISTSVPHENSRIYPMSSGDPSSRRVRAPSAAKPPPKVRVDDMAPAGRSAAVEGYKSERSGSTPSSSPPSAFTMSPSASPPSRGEISRTHSRQPSEALARSSSRRARAPSASTSASATPPDPSSSSSTTQPGQDTHGMTPSMISHSPSPSSTTTKSRTNVRPIEKKVSASARDLRLGLTMTPTPLVTPTTRPATRSRAQNISAEHEPSHHRDFFTASRRCSRCGEVVRSPRSSPTEPFSPRLLHLSCASCNTNHCRGCFKPTRCPPHCSGGSSCTVRTCCPSICAIALFEVLCTFDKEYAGFVGSSQTGEFINLLIARTDKRTRAFEGMLVNTLRSISQWLLQAASLSSSSESESSGSGIHPSIHRLFTASHLPSVMHAFLSHTLGAERDWVVHSEIYIALMDVIKHLASSSGGGGGLSGVLKEPVRRVEESCGVQAWMWDRGEVVWVGGGAEENGEGEGRSLGEAVKRLEKHRQGLERYGNKFKFAAMAEKIEMLCEGISYLLFQQLVGVD